MAEPESPTNTDAEDAKAKEPTPSTPATESPETEKPAVAKADASPKPSGAKKAPKQKKEQSAPAATAPTENLSLSADDVEKPKIVKAKGSKNVHSGIAHVLSTFNNTIVTITDTKGNVIGWSSAGKVGFKGS